MRSRSIFWTEPGWLIREAKEMRARVTRDDGKFCIRNLHSGKYELRASVNAGIDVTHIYVVLDRKSGSNAPMVVLLQLGT